MLSVEEAADDPGEEITKDTKVLPTMVNLPQWLITHPCLEVPWSSKTSWDAPLAPPMNRSKHQRLQYDPQAIKTRKKNRPHMSERIRHKLTTIDMF